MAEQFDLDAIAADDALLDLLAAGDASAFGGLGEVEDDPAIHLLAELRLAVEVDEPSFEMVDDAEAFLAACAAKAQDPFGRRVATRALAAGIAAVAALSVSGVAAAVTGDPLSPYERIVEKVVEELSPRSSFPVRSLDGVVGSKAKGIKASKEIKAQARTRTGDNTGDNTVRQASDDLLSNRISRPDRVPPQIPPKPVEEKPQLQEEEQPTELQPGKPQETVKPKPVEPSTTVEPTTQPTQPPETTTTPTTTPTPTPTATTTSQAPAGGDEMNSTGTQGSNNGPNANQTQQPPTAPPTDDLGTDKPVDQPGDDPVDQPGDEPGEDTQGDEPGHGPNGNGPNSDNPNGDDQNGDDQNGKPDKPGDDQTGAEGAADRGGRGDEHPLDDPLAAAWIRSILAMLNGVMVTPRG